MNKLKQAHEYLLDAVSRGFIPGFQLAYIDDGDYFDYAGYKTLVPEKEAVDEETIYDLASLSKVVSTTTCAMQLIEKSCFALDTRFSDILDDFPHREVTIRHLMAHSSGIIPDDKDYRKCRNRKELWDFFRNRPLNFESGSRVEYSDFGYIALGFAVEHFAGPLDRYAKENIFKPLKMHRTGYLPKDTSICAATEVTPERGVIRGIVHDGKALRMGGVSGNAGLFSDVKDLSRFARMIMNSGQLEGERILKKETVELLRNSYTKGLNINRTLGWLISDPSNPVGNHASKHYLFHTGFTGTSIYIDLERKLSVILLTNRVHPSRDNDKIRTIREDVHNILLKQED